MALRVWDIAALIILSSSTVTAHAETAEGTSTIPSIELPMSSYLSFDAREALLEDQRQPAEPEANYSKESIARIRQAMDPAMQLSIKQALIGFPVTVEHTEIAGVPVSIVMPARGVSRENRRRVLIELHPGAFYMGAGYGIVESAPIAALGQIRVISVAYRLTPEYSFQAATEDVAKVYEALLKEYPPQNIGIYGSSAGGLLTAESVVWFQGHNLPRPGAIGILCSGADARFDGDSRYTNPASGYAVAPDADEVKFMLDSYFGNADLKDPTISPVWSQEAMSRFPPTLVVTTSRAHEMSSAAFTHRELVRAGATAELHIWDGLPHVFQLIHPSLPESRELFKVVVSFFESHLGSKRPGRKREQDVSSLKGAPVAP
jgi:epsilon-lactone hydrolase